MGLRWLAELVEILEIVDACKKPHSANTTKTEICSCFCAECCCPSYNTNAGENKACFVCDESDNTGMGEYNINEWVCFCNSMLANKNAGCIGIEEETSAEYSECNNC